MRARSKRYIDLGVAEGLPQTIQVPYSDALVPSPIHSRWPTDALKEIPPVSSRDPQRDRGCHDGHHLTADLCFRVLRGGRKISSLVSVIR